MLNHNNYSWKAAIPALALLKKKNIPVVINTSKTFSEVKDIVKALALDTPFIVENGSAIFFKKSYSMHENNSQYLFDNSHEEYKYNLIGQRRHKILHALNQIKSQYKFESYSDWSIQKLCTITGLEYDNAIKSSRREFSEPFLWHDSEKKLDEFKRHFQSKGFRLLKGGRFYHLIGNCDKGVAINQFRAMSHTKNTPLICLGDSQNDVAMLNIADIPIVIRAPYQDFPILNTDKKIIYSQGIGPKGWNQEIIKVLAT